MLIYAHIKMDLKLLVAKVQENLNQAWLDYISKLKIDFPLTISDIYPNPLKIAEGYKVKSERVTVKA